MPHPTPPAPRFRRPVPSPVRALAGALTGLLLAGPAGATQPGEQPFSVALHMHGSLSEGLGSMEWHSDRAVQTGVVDAIWWTDHDWRIEHWQHTRRYDFENATVDTTLRVKETDDAYPSELRFWVPRDTTAATWEVSVVDSVVYEGSQALRLATTTSSTGGFVGLHMAQTTTRRQHRYSLAKRVKLHFAVYPVHVNNNSKFIVDVRLSDHPGVAHTLRYVLGSSSGEPASTVMLPFEDETWNTYDLDITADAIQLFTLGGADTLRAEDDNLYEVTIGLETRKASVQPLAFFDDYRIDSDSTLDGAALLAKEHDFTAMYEAAYPPVTQFIGTEISRYRAQPHLNAYAPNAMFVDYTGTAWSDSIYYAVDQVHAQGGAVSLNHVFGTDVLGDPAESPQHVVARINAGKRLLLASHAFGCEMLEAGYRVRQGIDLAGFLDTWDTVLGNAIWVTGIGVTDSHGTDFLDGWGPWQPGNEFFSNNFVTWLYAPQLDEVDLIAAMKSGRAYFGDPYVFDPGGTVDLWTTEGFPMGRVVLTDQDAHDVVVEIVGLPQTSTVRLRQGEIRENPPVEYLNVNYLRDELLSGTWAGNAFTDTVTIDTTVPSFVRIEVDDQGTATAFSNWIAFLRDAPAAGIPGPRVAASVGDVHVLRADEFTLTGAALTAGSPTTHFVVSGDEETPGLGVLEIDPGLLGEPDGVLGGGFTSYQWQNGVLTLVGFSGAGSTVELLWGATGAPSPAAGAIDRVSLSAGRPNPFGRGTVADLALPRPATVFLEVLDVSGRRVRLLADERFEAGVHRVEWDGRDAYGRSVANGVYFLRLTTMGETLTTKAVRIR